MSKLSARRQNKGLSQAQLSEKAGVSKKVIQHYEQGFRDINKAAGDTLRRLAKALDCYIEDLLE